MAKEIPSGLKDPFFKWSANVESMAAASSPLSAAKSVLLDLQKQLVQPSLPRSARTMLAKAISDQKTEVKRLEREAKEALGSVYDQRRMQLEIVYKLNALRTQLKRADVEAETKGLIAGASKKLEDLLVQSNKLTVDSLPDLLAKVEDAQNSISSLPDFVGDALAQNESLLEKVLERQDEAREFLKGQREQLKNMARDFKDELVNTGVRLADSIGVGAFNLGNLGRIIGKTYKGGAYALKTVKAIRDARTGRNPSEGSTDNSLLDKFTEYVAHTRLFQRRMMKAADKKDDTSKSLLSLLTPITSLLGNIGKVFGQGGVIGSLLATLGVALKGKVLPVLGSLLKGGLRILGPLGALAAAFGSGHWIGTQLNKLVQKPLADTIDYFFLKNSETGKTGLGTTIDNAKTAVTNTWSDVRSGASSVAKEASTMATNTWSDVRSGVSSAYNTASSAVANSPATSYVSRGIDSLASGADTVKSWVGNLFKLRGNVDVDGLDPRVQKNMIAMAKEYYALTGKQLDINSAKRSSEHQAYLYKTMPRGKAAPPGRSLHELGFAFDTQSAQGNELAKLGLLSKYGFDRPIKSEPWHIQPKGMTYAAAKQGIYSADGPVNQGSSTPVDTSITATESRAPVPAVAPAVSSSSGSKSTRAAQPSSKLGVQDVPTFDMSDGQLLALNLGVFA